MSEPESACAVPGESSEANSVPSAVHAPAAPSPSANDKIGNLSFLELLIVLSCYAFFFYKNLPLFLDKPTWSAALVLVAEGMTVLVLLTRRAAHSFSTAPAAWLLALGTTAAPALIFTLQQPSEPAWVGISLVVFGLCARMTCTLFLGRSFGLVAANRGVKRNGPYRLVRHPIYASYLLIHIGVFWLYPTPRNGTIYVICWSLMIWRILVEENHLRQDPAYVEYQQVVRYRLIPGVF